MQMKIKYIIVLLMLLLFCNNLQAGEGEVNYFHDLYIAHNNYSGFYGKASDEFSGSLYDVSHFSFGLTPFGIISPLNASGHYYFGAYADFLAERYAHYGYGYESSMYSFCGGFGGDLIYSFNQQPTGPYISAGSGLSWLYLFTNTHLEEISTPGFGLNAAAGFNIKIQGNNHIRLFLKYNISFYPEQTLNSFRFGLGYMY